MIGWKSRTSVRLDGREVLLMTVDRDRVHEGEPRERAHVLVGGQRVDHLPVEWVGGGITGQ